MLAGGNIPDLLTCVDTNTLRVYAPTPAVFVCGGRTDGTAIGPTYLSFRDAFLRGAFSPPLDSYEIVLAETANLIFPTGRYQDFFQFESDVAQIVELIVLFSESFGSATELGAFAMLPEIAKNLLVFIDDKNYEEMSYIALGPLKYLQDTYGDSATCVINCKQVGIEVFSKLTKLNLSEFMRIVSSAIIFRSKQTAPPTTFDAGLRGHNIKLITGLIQQYGSLTIDEIECFLFQVGSRFNSKDMLDFLLCAEFLGWIKKEKRGLNIYYSTRNHTKAAIGFKFQAEFSKMDRERWRTDVRTYWKHHDPDRFEAITAALGV